MVNEIYRPSGLILAPKRSGTNFAHDIIAPAFTAAVNEPLGLHNDTPGGENNPLSPWNYSSTANVSKEYGHTALKNDPYGALLARHFVGWLNEGGKLIKETDFLYLGWLLASVPLKTVVIHRDPRSSIASFKRYNLYDLWGYEEKMKRFAQTIKNTPLLNSLYGGIMSRDTFITLPYHKQLAFYYAIAIQEIVRNTKVYNPFETSYEDLVNNTELTFQKIMDFLQTPWNESIVQAIKDRTSETRDPGRHGTFRRKEDLLHFTEILTAEEEADIRSVFSDFNMPLPRTATVFQRLDKNEKTAREQKKHIQIQNVEREGEIHDIQNQTVIMNENTDASVFVAKTLTTNLQYAKFLQWLTVHDIPLSINGKPVFYNDLPQGIIHKVDGVIYVEEKYIDHPVNFINWIGAATYAAWVGGKLPSTEEWKTAIIGPVENIEKMLLEANIGQRYTGTTPVTFFPPNNRGIYDVLGNASIWLHNTYDVHPYEKMKAGLEWNHSPERGILPNPRPYWLGTSGLGVRPVFSSLGTYPPDNYFISKMQEIIDLVNRPHQDDKAISAQLFTIMEELFFYNKTHE